MRLFFRIGILRRHNRRRGGWMRGHMGMRRFFRRCAWTCVLVLAAYVAKHGLQGGVLGDRSGFGSRPSRGTVAVQRSSVSKSAGERVIVGKVTRVSDGDTIHVTDGSNFKHKIRLVGIDAPESSQTFGAESTKRLASLIANRFVKVSYSERDQYGRILGTVWLDDANINLSMVESGHAWAYHYNQDPQYTEAQSRAKRARRGLWIDPAAQDPWAYRKGGKSFPVPQRVDIVPAVRNGNANLPPSVR